MNKVILIISAIFSLASVAYSPDSRAAINNAYSVIYFDGQNNIIGQEVVWCNNVAKYQGVINRGNPNRIREEFGCGQPQVTCGSTTFNGTYWYTPCSPAGFNYGSWIVYFNSATGLTQSNYCNNSPSTAFVGHPACGLPAPSLVTGLGAVYTGFPPG